MTDEHLAEIGAILHRGSWQIMSFTGGMAERFMRELEAAGFELRRKPQTVTVTTGWPAEPFCMSIST